MHILFTRLCNLHFNIDYVCIAIYDGVYHVRTYFRTENLTHTKFGNAGYKVPPLVAPP